MSKKRVVKKKTAKNANHWVAKIAKVSIEHKQLRDEGQLYT